MIRTLRAKPGEFDTRDTRHCIHAYISNYNLTSGGQQTTRKIDSALKTYLLSPIIKGIILR